MHKMLRILIAAALRAAEENKIAYKMAHGA